VKALIALGGAAAAIVVINLAMALHARMLHNRERKKWKLDHEADMERLKKRGKDEDRNLQMR
jgi:hypothetical protein